MKALVYLGPRRMELQDVADPTPEPGEVVIATSASAICGSDLHGFREASPRRTPPLIMGHETVGRIDEVGDGVDPIRIGRRVVLRPVLACGACDACRAGRTNICAEGRLVGRELPGGFAERFAVPERAAVGLGAHVIDEVATLVEPLANAIHVTSRAVRPGDDVLVIGAGPIGVLMARMSLSRDAAHVFITDHVRSRLELARAQGASPIETGSAQERVRDETNGDGVGVVIDAVGVDATWELAIRAVRRGGRIETVGLGTAAATVDCFGVIGKEVSITGSYAWVDDEFSAAVGMIEAGAIDAAGWFTRSTFAEGQRAFEELVDTADRFKTVLVPAERRRDDADPANRGAPSPQGGANGPAE
jgi:2-desacetyl-2-hydroxyethyl bacteriochlorophyllide A dehydrogenase